MSIKHLLKRGLEKATGLRVFRRLPHGVDVFADIAALLPRWQADLVFDVGANVGQSATEFLSHWPQARVHCFEPVRGTFLQLQANLAGQSRATCHQLALGRQTGAGCMLLRGRPDTFVLQDPAAAAPPEPSEPVSVETLDDLCRRERVAHISYLKIDTEGHDLQVLMGGDNLLAQQGVDLVQVEVGLNPRNQLHVPLEPCKRHLEERRYFLFGLYQQVCEWPTGAPLLRRSNAVFASERIIQPDQRPPA